MQAKPRSSDYLARHAKHVKIPVYPGWLFVTDDLATLTALHKKFTSKEADIPECLGYTQMIFQSNKMVIILGIFAPRPDVIIHEAGHAALDVCDYVGIQPLDAQEAYCYLLDWFYTAIVSCLPKESEK